MDIPESVVSSAKVVIAVVGRESDRKRGEAVISCNVRGAPAEGWLRVKSKHGDGRATNCCGVW